MTTVLIVDDSLVDQKILSYMLEINGHHVLTGNNGQEALRLLSRSPVDLLISDINMPKMDGGSLLREIRSTSVYQKLPIIMLTSLWTKDEQLAAITDGANQVLTKPISTWQLKQAVEAALAGVH